MKISISNINMGQDSFLILKKSADRIFSLRGINLVEEGADYLISVKVNNMLDGERFVIESDEKACSITASDDLNIHAGLGRFFTESVFDGRGCFTPFKGKIDFVPQKPLRGMYFATHFYNFYQSAPIEKVYEVIEDLALRGCNNLFVWFDMHHFNSMDDPDAIVLADRMHSMLKYANRIGIKGSLTLLSNEGFASSPENVRAEWWIQNGYTALPDSHYHLEICPNKEGGLEEILKERRQMLERFADLDIAYVSYWPYDQGGCTCEKCSPWGANGYLKILPHFKKLLHEFFPQAQIIVSTWYFDKFIPGEWDAFYPHMKDGSLCGSEYIMSFFFNGVMPEVLTKNGIPEGLKFVDFPEISMYTCSPWGGFGAIALPRFLNTTNEKSGHLYSGGYPYSEGIFEDINKYMTMTYYSGLYPDARDAIRAYVKFEFCVQGQESDELADAIIKSETAQAKDKYKAEVTGTTIRFIIKDTSDIEYVYGVFEKYNKILPENITKSRSFRLWYIRAVLDRELMLCDGYPIRSELAQKLMKEVNDFYYADEKTCRWVKAPEGK